MAEVGIMNHSGIFAPVRAKKRCVARECGGLRGSSNVHGMWASNRAMAGPFRRAKVFHLGRRVGVRMPQTVSKRASPGDKDSKAVYDAFFLGKALAEAINERIGSAVGEFLSDVGRRQAEQQKQIREFQDEVQERAAAAAIKAAQKALAVERANKEAKPSTSTAPESRSQPPPSTSGLSNPKDTPTDISIE